MSIYVKLIQNELDKLRFNETPEGQEDKVIPYKFCNGSMGEARVDGCEFDIGITLTMTDNPINDFRGKLENGRDVRGEQMTCIHGLHSPESDRYKGEKEYNHTFYGIFNQLKKGYYKQIIATTDRDDTAGLSCAFNH